MANVTFDSEGLILLDNWAGAPNPHMGVPKDGFTGVEHHNVATAKYDIGTVIQVYNHSASAGVDGLARFVYGKLESQDATYALAVKHVCHWHSDATPFDFTNDEAADLGESIGPAVVAISAMTTDYYGWFWCGGVCPEEYIPLFAGAFCGNAATAIGPITSGNVDTEGATYGTLGFETPDADTDFIVGLTTIVGA